MRRSILPALAVVALLVAATPARSQDLHGATPCCGRICHGDGTSTRCGDLLPTGLGTLSGCLGIDTEIPATCVGGQLLDAPDMAVLDGCACVLGSCAGPIAATFGPMTPQQCSDAALAACQDTGNVVTGPDPNCPGGGGGETCPDSQTRCNGECVNTSNDPENCGGCGIQCGPGFGCQQGVCEECKNHSGGGDNTNPGGGGNPAGCNNPGGSK